MARLRLITTEDVLAALENVPASGFVDLTYRDFKNVEMSREDVRRKFTEVTERAARSPAENPIYIDLSFSNISRRNFSHYDLSHLILSHVKADRTVFAGSNLTDVKLDHASVRHADFRGANLRFAKLFETNITGANFADANLSGVYGLNLHRPGERTINRLETVSSLRGAILPDNVEHLRDELEATIEENHKNTNHDIIEHIGRSTFASAIDTETGHRPASIQEPANDKPKSFLKRLFGAYSS